MNCWLLTEILQPLHLVLADDSFIWTASCQQAFDRELLAAYLAVRHFQYFVEGRVFQINTDFKPFTFALHSSGERQARHLAFISEFMTDLRHIEGPANRVADALSCNILALDQSLINLDALASAQDQDEELLKLSTSPTFLQLAEVPLSHSGRTLLCDISQGHSHPLVPSAMCQAIFVKLHSLPHPGIKASRGLISEWYVWLNMKRVIACWTRTGHDCQQSKVLPQCGLMQSKVIWHVKAPLKAFTPPDCHSNSVV